MLGLCRVVRLQTTSESVKCESTQLASQCVSVFICFNNVLCERKPNLAKGINSTFWCCKQIMHVSLWKPQQTNKKDTEISHPVVVQLTDPRIWAPSIRSVSLWLRIFTRPSVSALVFALLLAAKGNLPILYGTPWRKQGKRLHTALGVGLQAH